MRYLSKEQLNIVDISQIVSTGATAIAAIMAMITTLQNRQSNKEAEKERHAMVKLIFIVKSTFEKRTIRQIDFKVKNIGYDKFTDILAIWSGSNGVDVEIKNEQDEDNRQYLIVMNYITNTKEQGSIEGNLTLVYTNVLGKKYNESIKVVIEKGYYDAIEEYNPELRRVTSEMFS